MQNHIASKLFIFLRAPDGEAPRDFQDRAAAAGLSSATLRPAAELSICRIGKRPEGLPRRPDDPTDPRPPYDAAIRAKFRSPAEAQTASVAAAQLLPAATQHAFLLTEIPVLDRLPPGFRPAIKTLSLIRFHDDLPDTAARRSWAQHAKLAAIIHVGAGRYVRNWVEQRGEGTPPIRGIVEIDCATLPDLVERYFGVPGGLERVVQDTGHFIQHAIRLYMREEKLDR